jgi:hypothetical protein
MKCGEAVLLFPSPYHGVLAVKGGARLARLRPGGRLRPLTACAAPCWRRFRAIPPEQPEIVMNDKSHVSLEQHVCLVCGSPFDTGSILLDKRLRASMERHTTTGWGLCPEHQKLSDDGFVALVECDPQRSGLPAAGTRLKPAEAYRTGRLAHLKREVCTKVFNVPIAANQSCVFVEPGIIERLQTMVQPASA